MDTVKPKDKDLELANLEFKLGQASYFLEKVKSTSSNRLIQDYYLSAFSNSIYTIIEYLKGLDKEIYVRLKCDEHLGPFCTDGREGGIRGLDVHRKPLKHNRDYFIGEHAEIKGNVIKLSDADCHIVVKINDKKLDLFDLCTKALEKVKSEVSKLQTDKPT